MPNAVETMLDLMFKFATRRIAGRRFVKRYVAAWREDRDARRAGLAKSGSAAITELAEARRQGSLSLEEIRRRWEDRLGGSTFEAEFGGLFDRVFTACDAFVEEAGGRDRASWQLDEVGLRGVVTAELAKYLERAVRA